MGNINSRSKGNRNERNIAKLFEKWTGKKFSKTPSSGGLQWKTTNSKGDIVCTKEGHYFPFCIEAKSYKELNFQHLLYSDKAEILKFWAQANRDADLAKKIPLLFMRTNGITKDLHFVVMHVRHFRLFIKEHLVSDCAYMYIKNHKIIIFKSTDLINTSYKEIKAKIKYHKKNG